ncbi:NUDIX domain-containing protein [Robertkochia marina]|uniref:GDP-mannose pyrophosphatase n=1 Tax=Robertkochia marina TaxID=1227945 RepID=A0A4S3LZL4_9FLAO|nr:NUDIX domain-containing protein [Robertkochia marina]THD65729.1 NUDIX domain-containing protein [Robertkochia marina]TRZ47036.1 NUDIX domain-containing protein [Robertkochia marina]
MNSRIKDIREEILSKAWYTLKRYTYQWKTFKGPWQEQSREVYDRGNGAAVLMYNSNTKKVLLIKQFRMPTWVNGNKNGLLLETPAGVLDSNDPEACMKREIEEETGYRVQHITPVFQTYMSPGAVTEILHFFTCDYSKATKVATGGGNEHETEDLFVEEYPFKEIRTMVNEGAIKDAKTLLLLQHGMLNGLI